MSPHLLFLGLLVDLLLLGDLSLATFTTLLSLVALYFGILFVTFLNNFISTVSNILWVIVLSSLVSIVCPHWSDYAIVRSALGIY
jgi:hypothetical protein